MRDPGNWDKLERDSMTFDNFSKSTSIKSILNNIPLYSLLNTEKRSTTTKYRNYVLFILIWPMAIILSTDMYQITSEKSLKRTGLKRYSVLFFVIENECSHIIEVIEKCEMNICMFLFLKYSCKDFTEDHGCWWNVQIWPKKWKGLRCLNLN